MIRAHDVVVRQGGEPLLSGLDLEVQPGELVVLTGEDGCGASTLLRVLAGTQAPDAGTVEGGPCALLPQPPGDDWADDDLVGLLVGPAGLPSLDALGASALVDRAMWTLSGGERQRARLARVLASDAPVLLLDEPLGYLDGAGTARVLDVLRLRAATGTAVLAVIKLDERGAAAADRVLGLDGGVLTARG